MSAQSSRHQALGKASTTAATSARTPLGIKNILNTPARAGVPDEYGSFVDQQPDKAIVASKDKSRSSSLSASARSIQRLPFLNSLHRKGQHVQPSPLRSATTTTTPVTLEMAQVQAQYEDVAITGIEEQADGADNLEVTTLRTPKKRAIPTEDTHPRNVVAEEFDNSPPHKKSRSSQKDTSSSHASSITGSISAGVSKLNVEHSQLPQQVAVEAVKGDSLRREALSNQTATKQPVTPATEASSLRRPAPTTTRIDTHSRMSGAERAARDETKRQQTELWKRRWLSNFPKLKFYLDGFDEKTKTSMNSIITRCGGSSDPFFSKGCTHIVTARKTLPPSNVAGSPSNTTTVASRSSISNGSKLPMVSRKTETKRFSPTKKGLSRRNKDLPIHSDRNPFEDAPSHQQQQQQTQATTSNDPLARAQEWGIKIWTVEKFWNTINLITGSDFNGTSATAAGKQDLAQLLHHEKVHGTSERDLNAPRDGIQYFDKRAIYILIEDATGEHRAIMCQEYDRQSDPSDAPPWPKLYGDEEGRCPFTKYERKRRSQRRPAVDDGRQTSNSKATPAHLARVAGDGGGEAASYSRNVSPAPGIDSMQGCASPAYQMASGNSVSVVSNMTSVAGTGSHTNLASLAAQDKRVAQLNRRMVPANNASPAVAMDSPLPGVANGPDARRLMVRSLLGMTEGGDSAPTTPGAFPREGMTRSVSLGVPLDRPATGRESRELTVPPTGLTRTSTMPDVHAKLAADSRATTATKPAGQAAPPAPAKEANDPSKRLYCENCRAYFDEFDDHIASNRHRKFAQNDANFADVDALINRCARPVAAWVASHQHSEDVAMTPGEGGVLRASASPDPCLSESIVSLGGAEGEGLWLGSRRGSDGDEADGEDDSVYDEEVSEEEEEGDATRAEDHDVSPEDEENGVDLIDGHSRLRRATPHLPAGYDEAADMGLDPVEALAYYLNEGEDGERDVDYGTSLDETEGHITPSTSPDTRAAKGHQGDRFEDDHLSDNDEA